MRRGLLLLFLLAFGCHDPNGANDAPAQQRPVTVEPLLLFIPQPDAGTSTLEVFDATGAPQGDLAIDAQLTDDDDGVRVTAGGDVYDARAPALQSRLLVNVDNPAQPSTPAAMQVVVRAHQKSADTTRLVGLDPDGAHLFEITLEGGAWDDFHVSPTGRYLLGDDGLGSALVLDTASGDIVFNGALASAMFTPDDSALVTVQRSARKVRVMPLPSGAPKDFDFPADLGKPAPPTDPSWAERVGMRPVLALADTFVFETTGDESWGKFLWELKPDGSWAAVDLQTYSRQSVLGLRARELIVDREGVQDYGVLGFDLDSHAVHSYGPHLGVYANGMLFTVDQQTLVEAWALGQSPSTVASVPAENYWQRQVEFAAADGHLFVVTCTSPYNGGQYPSTGTLIFNPIGTRVADTFAGRGVLDRTGKLYAQRPLNPGFTDDVAVLDLTRHTTAMLRKSAPFAIVYRRR